MALCIHLRFRKKQTINKEDVILPIYSGLRTCNLDFFLFLFWELKTKIPENPLYMYINKIKYNMAHKASQMSFGHFETFKVAMNFSEWEYIYSEGVIFTYTCMFSH